MHFATFWTKETSFVCFTVLAWTWAELSCPPYDLLKGFSIKGFILIYKKNACFLGKNHPIFILFNNGRLAINNEKQHYSYGLRGYVCRTMLFWWNFALHFRTFEALFQKLSKPKWRALQNESTNWENMYFCSAPVHRLSSRHVCNKK